MNRPEPAADLNGVGTGNICDRCNRRIQHGEKTAMYATWYDRGGWTPRRTWCMDCCPETIDPATEGADEAILVGVLFGAELLSLSVRDRNLPRMEGEQ
jgi:hypothetical protein